MRRSVAGWLCGGLGVVMFSGSMPATRLALTGFDPVFLTLARASLAGLLALGGLLLFGTARPDAARPDLAWPARKDLSGLTVVALGVVLGFPLLTALALRQISAAQSQIFLGLLPIATAGFGVLRGGERPRRGFWLFAALGAASVIAVALEQRAQLRPAGAALMLAAILVCGLGYAEGARLSQKLGGWQVISWALVLALPAALVLCWLRAPASLAHIPPGAWAGLGYVSVFSMLLGMVFWYRGLALGGIAAVGQLQLLQPTLGLAACAVVLHETVPPGLIGATAGVLLCVAGAKRFV